MAPVTAGLVLPAYQALEKVFCFHLELMYEAKIIGEPKRKDPNDPTSPWMYLVHYKGWKTTWDDWVSEDRLRKLTEDNRELAASLRRDVMQTESRARNPKPVTAPKKGRTQGSEIGSGRGSEERNSSVPTGGRGAKRGKDNEIEKVATPAFLTPRRSVRLQSAGRAQSTLPDSPDPDPDPDPSGSDDKDDKMETDDAELYAELPAIFNFGSTVAFTANKNEASNLQDAPARGMSVASTVNEDELSTRQDAPAFGMSVASTANEELSFTRQDAPAGGFPVSFTRRDAPDGGFVSFIPHDAAPPGGFPVSFVRQDVPAGGYPLSFTRQDAPAGGYPVSFTRQDAPAGGYPVSFTRQDAPARGMSVASTANEELSFTRQDAPVRGVPVPEVSFTRQDAPARGLPVPEVSFTRQDAPARGFPASTANEQVSSNRRIAPIRKPAGRGKRIKTMALRKIHRQYDDEAMKPIPLDFSEGANNLWLELDKIQTSVPMEDDVVESPGYFADGQFQSPGLEKLTEAKRRPAQPPGKRVSRQAERSVYQSALPPPGPDAEPVDPEEMYEIAKKALSVPPPPDEPEHMTLDTYRRGYHWAPLIGGTTQAERQQIEEEAEEIGALTPKKAPHHQEYIKTRINDPLNANRLHFLRDQDADRTFTFAGGSKEPNTHLDPPGSGLPHDALKYPEYLLQYPPDVLGSLSVANLNKLSRTTIVRFPNAALRRLPRKYLKKLKIARPAEANDAFQEESFYSRPSVHIPMPDMIKGYLVDDWENVTRHLCLVGLPSLCPVNWIIDEYHYRERDKRREGSEEAMRFREFCAGMQTYFAKMIGKTLLYKFERGQYAELTKLWEEGKGPWKGKGPGDCYGAEHLCRLIVSMPEYMARTDMDRQHVNQVKEELTLLMQWMCRNYERIFVNKYESPSAEYIEAARD
ncbi:hypothetical protein GJ744_010651 [Endocarpon pusillum]|uniref:Chromatin modification-related protein EAF3 n=1 Tax=Endocarpon pusillum TaxID=364733 RepID=A0A8H7AH45_9EURO|nr:hypothetical protein GJ744_010651 [Endocarpon pusillum]